MRSPGISWRSRFGHSRSIYVARSPISARPFIHRLAATTVGSDIVLPPRWKLLGPFEAVSGMLMFGLTTAFIFAVIQRLIHARFDGASSSLTFWGVVRPTCCRTRARTFGLKARKRERVRCSSLVDWPVYPRLRYIVQGSERAQCGPRLAWSKTAENRRDVGRADLKTPGLNSRPYWPGGVA